MRIEGKLRKWTIKAKLAIIKKNISLRKFFSDCVSVNERAIMREIEKMRERKLGRQRKLNEWLRVWKELSFQSIAMDTEDD